MKSTVLKGLEYSLAMVLAADLKISDSEKAEIRKIVQDDFFVRLAAQFGITPDELADSIISCAERIISVADKEKLAIWQKEAFPAICEAGQANDEAKRLILAAVKSLAQCDEFSEDEANILEIIVEALGGA
jgi:hypothetical protein